MSAFFFEFQVWTCLIFFYFCTVYIKTPCLPQSSWSLTATLLINTSLETNCRRGNHGIILRHYWGNEKDHKKSLRIIRVSTEFRTRHLPNATKRLILYIRLRYSCSALPPFAFWCLFVVRVKKRVVTRSLMHKTMTDLESVYKMHWMSHSFVVEYDSNYIQKRWEHCTHICVYVITDTSSAINCNII